jgi:hypothetical protein
MSLAEARLALRDLEREVNESLSELALPDLRAQVQAKTGDGFATYLAGRTGGWQGMAVPQNLELQD